MYECSRGITTNLLDCGREVNEFDLYSRYYFHFKD